jgi:glycosyltransferase involved in cell wall biosynthesis
MPRILIDLYKTKNIYSGLGQFSLQFATALHEQNNNSLDVICLVPKGFEVTSLTNFKKIEGNFFRRIFPFLAPKVAIWHSLHQFPAHFPSRKTKQLLTVHDLNFLIEKKAKRAAVYLKRLQRNCDHALVIVAISNYTKNELERHIDLKGKQVHVIHNGVELKQFTSALKPSYIDNQPYFFSIGIFNAKKNFEVLLPMLLEFPEHKLVIAGNHSTAYGVRLKELIQELKLENRVILPGKITEEEKFFLYQNCKAFLFPSLAEGFGIPVIEAMRLGKPTFLSNTTCLPEIGGDSAYYFDSFEPKVMAEFVKEKLSVFHGEQASNTSKLVAHSANFSWEKCIKTYVELYISMENSQSPQR